MYSLLLDFLEAFVQNRDFFSSLNEKVRRKAARAWPCLLLSPPAEGGCPGHLLPVQRALAGQVFKDFVPCPLGCQMNQRKAMPQTHPRHPHGAAPMGAARPPVPARSGQKGAAYLSSRRTGFWFRWFFSFIFIPYFTGSHSDLRFPRPSYSGSSSPALCFLEAVAEAGDRVIFLIQVLTVPHLPPSIASISVCSLPSVQKRFPFDSVSTRYFDIRLLSK